MALDLTKQVKTRGGLDVKIYSTDNGGTFPVHGAVQESPTKWSVYSWTPEGKVIAVTISGQVPQHDYDLVNVPRTIKAKRWIKILRGADGKSIMFGTQVHSMKPTQGSAADILEFELEYTEPMEGHIAPGDEIVDIDEDSEGEGSGL